MLKLVRTPTQGAVLFCCQLIAAMADRDNCNSNWGVVKHVGGVVSLACWVHLHVGAWFHLHVGFTCMLGRGFTC